MNIVSSAMRRHGTENRMGAKLRATFVAAGLPEPTVRLARVAGEWGWNNLVSRADESSGGPCFDPDIWGKDEPRSHADRE